jgi:Protein of unknown function (DUF3500)
MSRLALAAACAALLAGVAFGQAVETHEQRRARFQQMSRDAEARGLAAPYKGITAGGQIVPGLFPVRSTGVSTAAVRNATEQFLASLTRDQRAKTVFPLDDPEWRKWMNQDYYVRQGVSFLEMTPAQRDLGIGMLRASLSAKGLKQTRDIMRLNYTLGELNDNDFDRYGEWRYHITVMGTPSPTEPWGWQFDGHHAIVNYFVMGDQVVMTPFFAGSEPVTATSGKFAGTSILQEEQNRGLEMIRALSEPQRKQAVLKVSKTGNENVAEAWKDNVALDYAGVRASELPEAQKKQLTSLIALYVGNMDDGHARVKMDEVLKHFGDTWFAWIGGTEPGNVFYYRIHSPVILIEFDHQVPANLKHLAKDPNVPNPQHIHVVVRTPNGNDYGKDLLRQHYAQHSHGS